MYATDEAKRRVLEHGPTEGCPLCKTAEMELAGEDRARTVQMLRERGYPQAAKTLRRWGRPHG